MNEWILFWIVVFFSASMVWWVERKLRILDQRKQDKLDLIHVNECLREIILKNRRSTDSKISECIPFGMRK